MTHRRRDALSPALCRVGWTWLALVLGFAAVPASAEIVAEEDEYRDWVGRCETETETGEVICFIYTVTVGENEEGELATRLMVGINDQLQPVVFLDVPETAEPATGFGLRVDSQQPFSGRFVDCTTGWCRSAASGEIADALIAQFRAGSRATVSFKLEDSDRQVDMPLSLLGFTAAYERLLTIHQRAMDATAAQANETPADGTGDGGAAGGASDGDGDGGEPPAEPAGEDTPAPADQ
ncbi:MAG: invasion associated locus B family protein [Alphaproteobacteria bacterium]